MDAKCITGNYFNGSRSRCRKMLAALAGWRWQGNLKRKEDGCCVLVLTDGNLAGR